MIDFECNKGKLAKDNVSGFEGKITGVAEYIDGYRSIRLTKLKPDGSITEPWFNESTIEIIE